MLFKILDQSAWDAAEDTLPWAPIDVSDGFIHLSASDQVVETAEKHFANRTNLVLIEVDPDGIPEGRLRWEPSRGGALFPHVYGDVPLDAVRRTASFDSDAFPVHLLQTDPKTVMS